MKRATALVAGLIGAGLFLMACAPADDVPDDVPVGDGSGERILLVSGDEERDGRVGMDGLFEGRLTLTQEKCVVGETDDGMVHNLDFPAGTFISPEDVNTVVLPFGELTIGDDVSLGGGGAGGRAEVDSALEDLPEGCRQPPERVFGVYTIG